MRALRVLITGGTGTFGHAMVARLLADDNLNRITILSRDEHKQDDMARKFNDPRLIFFVGDVRDRQRVSAALKGQDVVIHAAAMKVIHKCELDPIEAIKTNIIGTQNVIEGCLEREVWKTLLISTDKACSPYNLYGATKLAAERLTLAANNLNAGAATSIVGHEVRRAHKCLFSVVRYGNVTGSRGSVIPVWEEQYQAGLPLSITHEDMWRFWLHPTQAVDFVAKAIETMEGGEIFVPRMPTYKITDLLVAFRRLKGTPIQSITTGIRQGEKLYEDIITLHECRSGRHFGSHGFVITPMGETNEFLKPYDSRNEEDRMLDEELLIRLAEFIACPSRS